MDVAPFIHSFFAEVRNGSVEVYNELSLQIELGIFLRNAAPSGGKVRFERPVTLFKEPRQQFTKKEIDIVLISPQGEKQAIELKYPSNGQYPEQMYKACQDVLFLEQLVGIASFGQSYFVMLARDPLFFQGPTNTGIYAYFRGDSPIHGIIQKPTGSKGESLPIAGSYQVQWYSLAAGEKYALLEITRST